jgi:hypothetical protein
VGNLDTGGSTILDANGNGTVTLAPSNSHEDWTINNTVVQVSSNVNEPQCRTYVGAPTTNNIQDTTYTGSNDSSDTVIQVSAGTYFTVVWSGGDVGARASVSISGTAQQRFGSR